MARVEPRMLHDARFARLDHRREVRVSVAGMELADRRVRHERMLLADALAGDVALGIGPAAMADCGHGRDQECATSALSWAVVRRATAVPVSGRTFGLG